VSASEPVTGYLVITAINGETAEASSETYQLTRLEHDGDTGERAVFHAQNEEGDSWVITHRPVAAVPLEVEPYRELVQALIAADEPCMGVGCRKTMLGHLLASMTPEQVELIRELDPDQP
jgi:uncharacterized protein YndB with AHSA1/START domain